MDLNEIKDIIDADGGKFIIVEDGRPILVAMSFDEYKQKVNKAKQPSARTGARMEENREEPEDVSSFRAAEELEDVKIEDLPLE